MADLCPVLKGSSIWIVVWKLDQKKPVYGPKCLVFEWSAKSCDFTIWIPDTHTVRYSDESDIQVFGIQMVTVSTSGQRSQVSSCPDKVVPGVHLKELTTSSSTSSLCSEASPCFADSSSTGSGFPEESAVVAMSLTVIVEPVWTAASNLKRTEPPHQSTSLISWKKKKNG